MSITPGEVYNISIHHIRLYKALGWVKDMAVVTGMSATNTPALVPTRRVDGHVSVTEFKNERGEIVGEIKKLNVPVVIEDMHEFLDNEEKLEAVNLVMDSGSPLTSEVTSHLDVLRQTATNLGINIDGRWGIERLQKEIDEFNRLKYSFVE